MQDKFEDGLFAPTKRRDFAGSLMVAVDNRRFVVQDCQSGPDH